MFQEIITKGVLHPAIRVLSTTRFAFPSGSTARVTLANKYLEAMHVLGVRLGKATVRSDLSVSIQRFFLAFDKANNSITDKTVKITNSPKSEQSRISSDVADSYSPPIVDPTSTADPQRNRVNSLLLIYLICQMYMLNFELFSGFRRIEGGIHCESCSQSLCDVLPFGG